jgi:hypothetical protein
MTIEPHAALITENCSEVVSFLTPRTVCGFFLTGHGDEEPSASRNDLEVSDHEAIIQCD